MKQKAILIMTSAATSSGLRSAHGIGWSKLYQASDYYFDLSLKPEESQRTLLGQVLRSDGKPIASGAQATLLDAAGMCLAQENLSATGAFRLVSDQAASSLDLALGEATFELDLN